LTAISGNYAYAKKILFDKYRIRQEIVDDHMESLHDLEPCFSGCVEEIQRVFETFKRHLESVDLQGVHLDGQMLLYVYKSKLDAETLHDFRELSIGSSHLQTLTGLTHFLSERVSLLKDLSEDRMVVIKKVRQTVASIKKLERQNAENVFLDRIRVRQEEELEIWTRTLRLVRREPPNEGLDKTFPDVFQEDLPDLEEEILRTDDETSEISDTGYIHSEFESDSEAEKERKLQIKRPKLVPCKTFAQPNVSVDKIAAAFASTSVTGTPEETEAGATAWPDYISLGPAENPPANCPCCHSYNHNITYCKEFVKLGISQRQSVIINARLCFKCLRDGHFAQRCPREWGCGQCLGEHHAALHHPDPSESIEMRMQRRVRNQRCPAHVWHLNSGSNNIMLATAIGYVKDAEGKLIECRIMLDSGSQSSLVTEEIFLASKKVKKNSRKYLLGLGDRESVEVKGEVVLDLVFQNGNSIEIGALILDTVSSLMPAEEIDVSNFTRRTEIGLSDENFHIPAKIDILLGSDVYYDMILPKPVKRVQGFCILETILGKHAVGEIGRKVVITKSDVSSVIQKNSVEVYNKTRSGIHIGVARVKEDTAKEDPKTVQEYMREKYPLFVERRVIEE
jgi:hypothetical protein